MSELNEFEEIPEDFEETFGIRFSDPKLIQIALSDPSYVGGRTKHPARENNRRLEHVGDGFVSLVLREYLYRAYGYFEASDFQEYVSAWASNAQLAEVARDIGLDEFVLAAPLRFPDDAEFPTTRQLACAFEAVVGAIFVDAGYEAARAFLHAYLIPRLPRQLAVEENPKGRLQDTVTRSGRPNPRYEVVAEGREEAGRRVVSRVYAGDDLLGEGEGTSPRRAHLAAAQNALARLE